MNKKIMKCPECGENNFYAEEVTMWTGELVKEKGKITMEMTNDEAGGIKYPIVCQECGFKIEEDDEYDFDIEFY